MTRENDIQDAERLGVDFIGFIFVASSPRSVTFEQAKMLRPAVRHAKLIGIFEDASRETMTTYHAALHFDFIEWYGKPDKKLLQSLPVPGIQAFRGAPSEATARNFLSISPYILIDKEKGAETAGFDRIKVLPAEIRNRIIIAGGLTPNNVGKVVQDIEPFAVDCARGIESAPGVKNYILMNQFITAVRNKSLTHAL